MLRANLGVGLLLTATDQALAAGVRPGQILWDPGLGFAKTTPQNLELIRRLDQTLGNDGHEVTVLEARGTVAEAGSFAAAGLIARHPHVIVVRTLSKAFSLAGLRVGYALAAPDVAAMVNRAKDIALEARRRRGQSELQWRWCLSRRSASFSGAPHWLDRG